MKRMTVLVILLVSAGVVVLLFAPIFYMGTVSGGPPPPVGPVRFDVYGSLTCKLFGFGVTYFGSTLYYTCELPRLI
jgi:hypothetical protein